MVSKIGRVLYDQPFIIMGVLIVGCHIGWKRLQSVPGTGTDSTKPYPHVKIYRLLREKLLGGQEPKSDV